MNEVKPISVSLSKQEPLAVRPSVKEPLVSRYQTGEIPDEDLDENSGMGESFGFEKV